MSIKKRTAGKRSCRGVAAAMIGLMPHAVSAQQAATATEADVSKPFPGAIRLLLPPRIYAVPGIEMNVYFDNVCLALNPANYAFDVTCSKGMQQAERWNFVPQDEDVGEYPFVLVVRNEQNAIIARAESTLKIAPRDSGKATLPSRSRGTPGRTRKQFASATLFIPAPTAIARSVTRFTAGSSGLLQNRVAEKPVAELLKLRISCKIEGNDKF